MLKAGDLVITKECEDVRPSRGRLLGFTQYKNTKKWSVKMQWGDVLLFWENELVFNPQKELFDSTCYQLDLD